MLYLNIMGRHSLPKNQYIGQTHGGLTLLSFECCKPYYCKVLCICGKEKEIYFSDWKNERQKSCGCLSNSKGLKHGLATTPEYYAWYSAKQRCYNSSNPMYKNYGARGITMSEEWINSPEQFLCDMGKRPGKGYSIDRKDNNGNYCKENCKWSTPYEQVMNRRNTLS